jgi:5-methylcytosine-specific restriction protein A
MKDAALRTKQRTCMTKSGRHDRYAGVKPPAQGSPSLKSVYQRFQLGTEVDGDHQSTFVDHPHFECLVLLRSDGAKPPRGVHKEAGEIRSRISKDDTLHDGRSVIYQMLGSNQRIYVRAALPRMKQLAPRGRQLKPRGQSGPVPVQSRDRVDTWRAWYKTAEWRAIRWDVLVSAAFTCVRCKRVYPSADLVGDHKRPHRGDCDLFFDRTNVQCMCATCHNRDKYPS